MNSFDQCVVKLYSLLNKGVSISDTLDFIYKNFSEHIPYNRLGIALLDRDGKIYSESVRSSYNPLLEIGYSLELSGSSLDKVIRNKENRIINDYPKYLESKPDSISTRLMIKEGIRSSIACPLLTNDTCIGILFFSSLKPNSYNNIHIDKANIIANNIAITVEKNLLVDDLILASITGFTRLVEAKDSDTGFHLERMQNYSKIIASKLSNKEKYKSIVTPLFLMDIFKFSPLHDIGKVGIADGILLKPAKLTYEEFEVMKRHTIIGADVLRKASNNLLRNGRTFFNMAIDIALGHHERYDGTGYPDGLKGDDIPLCARIVMAADVFDALTSKRVYKMPIDIEMSFKIILEESGKSFDPDVVEALIEGKSEIYEIYEKYKENIDWR